MSAEASIREIHEDELPRWVGVFNATMPERASEDGLLADFLDWKRQAPRGRTFGLWRKREAAGSAPSFWVSSSAGPKRSEHRRSRSR